MMSLTQTIYIINRGELYKLDNRVVEIYTFFISFPVFFNWVIFFFRDFIGHEKSVTITIQDIPLFHWLAYTNTVSHLMEKNYNYIPKKYSRVRLLYTK